jgi:ABC-type transporter Mla subunit MlaD
MDERIELLRQSIASHDRQLGELVEKMDRVDEQIVQLDSRLTARIDQLTVTVDQLAASVGQYVSARQLNFDRLSTAMMGLIDHVADHQRRLERLES